MSQGSGRNRVGALAALAALTLWIAGCRKGPATATGAAPIKIGEVAALTGSSAGLGQYTHRGVLMAVEEINASGGLLGRPVALIAEDTRSAAGETASATRKLINRDKVLAMVGEGASGRCLEGAQIAQQFRTPVVTPCATSPKVTAVGDEIFRVCFSDPFQGQVMARFCLRQLRARRVGLLVDGASEYSVGLAEFFRREFQSAGGLIVGEQRFTSGEKDFHGPLTALKAAGCEALFAPCYYGDAGLILLQARQLGITQPLLGGDGWEAPELVEIAGAAAEGACFPVHFAAHGNDPRAEEFAKRFTARHGGPPTGVSALGYDALQVIAEAIRRAGRAEREPVRAALAGMRDFPGVTGVITMDADRNARKPASIIEVRRGRFEFVASVSP